MSLIQHFECQLRSFKFVLPERTVAKLYHMFNPNSYFLSNTNQTLHNKGLQKKVFERVNIDNMTILKMRASLRSQKLIRHHNKIHAENSMSAEHI